MIVQTCSKGIRSCRLRVSLNSGDVFASCRRFSGLRSFSNVQRSAVLASFFTRSGPPASVLALGIQLTRRTSQRPILNRVTPYSTQAKASEYLPVKDDSHPSLFYHFFEDDSLIAPVFSLSFLEERPLTANSKTVLGWLPAVYSKEEEEEYEDNGNSLNDFVPNQEFLPILHRVIQEGLLEDEIWTNGAIQTQNGWMHIFDQRKIPPLGRIPEPDDILASVRVEDGRMLINTYEPMPSYRLTTADGVCQLTDTLMDRLKTTLSRVAQDERQNN